MVEVFAVVACLAVGAFSGWWLCARSGADAAELARLKIERKRLRREAKSMRRRRGPPPGMKKPKPPPAPPARRDTLAEAVRRALEENMPNL